MGKPTDLFIIIIKDVSKISILNHELAEAGVRGGTILDGRGMASSLVDMDDLPIFGVLRRVMADEQEPDSKVLMFVLRDEQLEEAKKVVRNVLGDLSRPNTGIMFSLPVSFVEGLGE